MLKQLLSQIENRLKTDLLDVYNRHHKSISKIGIPLLLTAFLSLLYISFSSSAIDELVYYCFYIGREVGISLWMIPVLGFLRLNDVIDKIDVVMKYPRVSSPSQEDGNSLEDQNDVLDATIVEINPDEVVVIGNEWESADTMFRENIDKVVNLVEDGDRTYCLMFRSVDRMTRAEILEAAIFLWKMKQEEVILYFADIGFFDLSTSFQIFTLMMKVISAREEYLNIITRGKEGRKSSIKDDEWPAPAPYGYEKENEDSNKLKVKPREAEIVERAFELTAMGDDVEAGNASQVYEELHTEFEEEELPSYNTLLDVLRRSMYTGVMTHDGEELGNCPEIVSEKLFLKVQNMLPDRSSNPTEEYLDHALKKVINKFGTDASLDLFEEVIKGKCPQCGADVKPWGSETRKGKRVKSYRCVNHPEFDSKGAKEDEGVETDEEETCDFEGPLLTTKFMDQWDSTVPLVCISCHQPLDDSKWEKSPNRIGFIEQTCEFCGTTVCTDLSENKYERIGEVPSPLHFFEDNTPEKASSEKESGEGSPQSEESDDESDGNMDVLAFG